jgi:hypothetical protein
MRAWRGKEARVACKGKKTPALLEASDRFVPRLWDPPPDQRILSACILFFVKSKTIRTRKPLSFPFSVFWSVCSLSPSKRKKMAWLLGVILRCMQLQGLERKSNSTAALSSNHLSPCRSNALFCWKAEVFSDCGPLVFTNRGLRRLCSKRSKRVRQDSWVW